MCVAHDEYEWERRGVRQRIARTRLVRFVEDRDAFHARRRNLRRQLFARSSRRSGRRTSNKKEQRKQRRASAHPRRHESPRLADLNVPIQERLPRTNASGARGGPYPNPTGRMAHRPAKGRSRGTATRPRHAHVATVITCAGSPRATCAAARTRERREERPHRISPARDDRKRATKLNPTPSRSRNVTASHQMSARHLA